jgi:EmrB/QacA subfamily drug resistance transporter
VVLAIAASAFSLLQSLVSPVLPLLQRELHTDQSTVTWVLTAYLLAASVATPIIGRVGDAVGKARVMVCVLLVLSLGSVVAALATNILVMICARLLQGVGGGVIPLSFGIIRDECPRERVPDAVGVIAALLAVGGGLGLVLAGPIVNTLGYHWLFWIPAVVVGLTALVTWLVVPPSPARSTGGMSASGAVLLSVWLVLLLVGTTEAPSWGWTSPLTLGEFAAAMAVAGLWVVAERRARHPMVDMRMLGIRSVWTTNLVAFMFGVGLYSMFACLPAFLQTPPEVAGYGFGASVTESGVLVLPMSLAMFVLGSASGSLSTRFGAQPVLVFGAALSITPMILLALAHDRMWQVAVAMALLGGGFGLAFAAMSNLVVDAVPSHQTGVASGMNANIRTIGGSLGSAGVGSFVSARLLPGGYPAEASYTTVFAGLAVVMLLATLAGLLIPSRRVGRDPHQMEQAAMQHPAAAIVAGAPIVGDDPV